MASASRALDGLHFALVEIQWRALFVDREAPMIAWSNWPIRLKVRR
jgi:hypothetical protein